MRQSSGSGPGAGGWGSRGGCTPIPRSRIIVASPPASCTRYRLFRQIVSRRRLPVHVQAQKSARPIWGSATFVSPSRKIDRHGESGYARSASNGLLSRRNNHPEVTLRRESKLVSRPDLSTMAGSGPPVLRLYATLSRRCMGPDVLSEAGRGQSPSPRTWAVRRDPPGARP